eukprot:3300384-Amphidinium_carterae.1
MHPHQKRKRTNGIGIQPNGDTARNMLQCKLLLVFCSSTSLCASSSFYSDTSWSVLVICASPDMRKGRGCVLSAEEAAVLCESASCWPGSMLGKDTFMELLGNILSLEYWQISEWEKQLVATKALGDAGKVDVQLFVAASSLSTTFSDPGTIMIPEVGLQSLAPTS